MRILLGIIIVFNGLGLFSQTIKFNKIYPDTFPTIRSVLVADSGYIAIGGSYRFNDLKISIYHFDSLGNMNWSKLYGADDQNYFHGFNNSITKLNNGTGYVLCGDIQATADSGLSILTKFNNNFDTIWQRRYPISKKMGSWDCVQTPDGGFAVCGYSFGTDTNGSGLLMRMDSLGNLLWYKEYGVNGNGEFFQVITNTHDKGFLLGGSSLVQQVTQIGYLVKTDSLGNLQWQRYYPSPTGLSNFPISEIFMTQDTSYLLSTTLITSGTDNYDRYMKARLIKLNKNFDVSWDKLYGEESMINSFGQIVPLGDSVFFINGAYLNSKYNPVNTLTKVDNHGNVLKYKEIFHKDSLCENYGPSFALTSDGGVVLGGWVYCDTVVPHQQVWLVKLDSNWCDGLHYCDTTTVIDTKQFEEDFLLRMYPNPTAGILHLETRINEVLNYSVYNLQGHAITKGQMLSRADLDLSGYPPGLYIVQLVTGRGSFARRFVKH